MWFIATVLFFVAVSAKCNSEQGSLFVGAARVDITPSPNRKLALAGYAGRPDRFDGIHDHIYARAIVLSDGSNKAVILSWELLGMPSNIWERLKTKIVAETGIPAQNLLLAGEHTHSAPVLVGIYGPHSTVPSREVEAYTSEVVKSAIEAIHEADKRLEPAKFGFGSGLVYVNINRRMFFPEHNWWWLGFNPEGPSDKSLFVLKFTDLSGRPIALLINYPVHATVMGPENLLISGDVAGATSRYVELYYQGKLATSSAMDLRLRSEEKTDNEDAPVALWTSGAAGDQDPISMDRGEDFSMVDGLGKILGEESVRVANHISVMSSRVEIAGAQRLISCPGRRLLEPNNRPRVNYAFVDSGSVDIRLTLLMLNRVALVGVSGEPFSLIYQRLREKSPLRDLIMVTHANGSSGYIPTDDSFDHVSYEITASDLKPGCAETSIMNNLLEMMGTN